MEFTAYSSGAAASLDQIRDGIRETHKITKSWRKAGEPFGLNPASARLLAMGHEPGEKLRQQLGLPRTAPVPVCPDCGDVHTIDGVCLADAKVTVIVVRVTPEELAELPKPVRVVVKTPRRRKPELCADCRLEYRRVGHAGGCLFKKAEERYGL
jgi:hypothetical protein